DGELDPEFGTNGKVITDFDVRDVVLATAIQNDGKILAVGWSGGESAADFALARYNPDGSLDTSFGSNGRVITDFDGGGYAYAAAVQPDGKIVAAGFANPSGVYGFNDFALARYLNPSLASTPTATSTATATPPLTGQAVYLPLLVKQAQAGW
ncbi:MAG TPA: delta-60 repeat domain-containing protein, partial [Chloroflexota bacterium]|nr:delta-60 repeat domain-containing protein [Chloroflexota bacterium]